MKNTIKQLRKPKALRIIIGGLMIVLILAGYLFYVSREGRVGVDNSIITAPVIPIAPPAPGKLTAILVHEGEAVTKGDALAVVGSNTIRSDSDGIITNINLDTGSSVSPQAPIMQMINPDHLRVDGTIDENKGLDQIRVGQVASFTVDAFPGKTFWGYVDEVSPSAKSTQLAFSISSERPTQQFDIYVRFNTKAYPQIKNGMSAKTTIFTKTN